MRRLPILALCGLTIFSAISLAQMRTPAITLPGAVAPSGFGRSLTPAFNGGFHHRPFGPGAIVFASPYYADYTEPSALPPVPPQVVIVQPANASDAPLETKAEPLLIELQGDHYVRFGARHQSAERNSNAPPDFVEEAHPSTPNDQHLRPELPPAILIFRDGHREPVPEYVIVGGTIYANGDYWQSGHWTRNIQLTALDLPATIRANREAGIKFTIPSASNEVVTRP